MSTNLETAGRIVVGMDGSQESSPAVLWAAARAARKKLPLLIVHVVPVTAAIPVEGAQTETAEKLLAQATERTRLTLEAAVEHVRQANPGLEVSSEMVTDRPSYVLAHATRDAALVVVGARGQGASLKVRALGGTADAVMTHAHGPVAVVPEGAVLHDGPVVVGIDDSPEAHEALRIAAEEATDRGVPLVAIHAWSPDYYPADITAVLAVESETIRRSLGATLARIVNPILDQYPSLAVDKRVELSHPAEALVRASETASEVVMGSRGRGGFTGLLLGSVSKDVARQASCPVIVTRGPSA